MQAQTQGYIAVRLFFKRLLLVALSVVVIVAAPSVWNIYTKEHESAVIKAQAQAQLADLEARKQHLEASIANLETNRGKEAALRQQYDMGKQGEGMIMIIAATASPPVAATSSSGFKAWVKKVFPWWYVE